MRRRDSIKMTARSAMAWPLAARAQQITNLPKIRFMGARADEVIEYDSFCCVTDKTWRKT
jgi:hypothetical protein